MKRLPFNCRRCGQPCRDEGGQCIGCEDRENSLDAAIARKLFAPPGRARESRSRKEQVES